jgi:hypothetical protein
MAVFSTVFKREDKVSGEVEGLAHVCARPLVNSQDRVRATMWHPIAYANP